MSAAPVAEVRRQLVVDDAIEGDIQGRLTADHCRTGFADADFLYRQLAAIFDSLQSRPFRQAFIRAIQKDLEAMGPR